MVKTEEDKKWINSPNFMKRALAIYGHTLFVELLILSLVLFVFVAMSVAGVVNDNTPATTLNHSQSHFQGPVEIDTNRELFITTGNSEKKTTLESIFVS